MRRLTTLLALAGLALGTTTALAASAATVGTRSTSLGTVLVGPNGHTLYMFSPDTKTKSHCTGECAVNWPPLTTKGAARVSGSAKASELGSISRGGGVRQVTYDGHPLYEYIADTSAGQTSGQATDVDGGWWYVLSANGSIIKKSSKAGGGSTKGAW
jgi:predicted lipoprotein with Yx(FWY)xxD motif